MKRSSYLLAVAASVSIAAGASAQNATGILPSNAFITLNGFDWAWAYPLPGSSGGFTLSGQTAYGWYVPTAAELAFAPAATDFLFAGGNVPFGGSDPATGAYFDATNGNYTGDAACATPWFSTGYNHCDWQDGLGEPYGPWTDMNGAFAFSDQLVVRASSDITVTPEPATMSLIATGLAGMAAARRRRKQQG